MKVVRYAPNTAMLNEFDRFFENAFRPAAPVAISLALDVAETEDAYTVKASVPGVNVEDVEITFEDKVLSIKGESKSEEEVEGETYHMRERRSGSFSRTLRFPVAVEADAIEATVANGILTLRVPKAEEVKPKRIEIKAS